MGSASHIPSAAREPYSNKTFRAGRAPSSLRSSGCPYRRSALATCALLLLVATALAQNEPKSPAPAVFSATQAAPFVQLALDCVHKQYPNHISHLLNSDADVQPPSKLTPAFYGCLDWHSSVHGHWLLARAARTWPEAPFAAPAMAALQQSITPEHIAAEVKYLQGPGRQSFERPYGLAWLMMLGAELREWGASYATGHDKAKQLATTLEPLEAAVKARLNDWLPKIAHPIRIGEHNQTAFSFGLLLDAARLNHDDAFATLLVSKATQFYMADRDCPLAYEPSGEDFLSPCLAEADLMRRVLPQSQFATWLTNFLPSIPGTPGKARPTDAATWARLKPETVPDPTDPKLAHLDGLNLSRAWMLNGIASALPNNDSRLPALRAAADAHRQSGLAAVSAVHYEGAHWLGTYAVYLVTHRGIPELSPPAAKSGQAR